MKGWFLFCCTEILRLHHVILCRLYRLKGWFLFCCSAGRMGFLVLLFCLYRQQALVYGVSGAAWSGAWSVSMPAPDRPPSSTTSRGRLERLGLRWVLGS